MNIKKLLIGTASIICAAFLLFSCGKGDGNKESDPVNDPQLQEFRPVDCGIQALDNYDYPFLGMSFTLTDNMKKLIDNRDVFVFTDEFYKSGNTVAYAFLRFSATTEEEKNQSVLSVDIFSWEEALEKVGVIGVYLKERVAELDSLTMCDTHVKLGESADGSYEYYLSTASGGNAEYIKELSLTSFTVTEMHELDTQNGHGAFSQDKIDGLVSVGSFSAEDVFGKSYTEKFFSDYDITLVNCFTTWCSPCVNEMPELEKLRASYEKEGKKVGVMAVVLDAKTQLGIDDGAVKKAKTLHEKCGAAFPFIIPDDTSMNGRLIGIESVPESFFVDKNGNIVGETYVGARSLSQWQEIVEAELEKLG